jgi:hypothetical protein
VVTRLADAARNAEVRARRIAYMLRTGGSNLEAARAAERIAAAVLTVAGETGIEIIDLSGVLADIRAAIAEVERAEMAATIADVRELARRGAA